MKKLTSNIFEVISEYSVYGLIIFLPISNAMIEIFAVSLIVSWAINRRDKIFVPHQFSLLDVAIFLFIITNLISVVSSLSYQHSVRAFFSKTLEVVLLFYALKDTLRVEGRLRKVCWVSFATLILIVVDSSVQYIFGTDFLRGRDIYREEVLLGPFRNPNDMAGWLIMYIPIVFMFVFSEWKKNGKLVSRASLEFLGVCLLICLTLTFSWAAYFSLFLGLCFLFFFLLPFQWNFSLKKILLTIFLIFVILLIGSLIFFGDDILTKENSLVKTFYAKRVVLWQGALNILKEHPWFGSGLNTYTEVIRKFSIVYYGNQYPHNSYIHMASEIGIVGLGSFLLIFIIFFFQGIRVLIKTKDPYFLGLLSGIFSFLVHSFFDTNFYGIQLVTLLWVFVAITVVRLEQLKGSISDDS